MTNPRALAGRVAFAVSLTAAGLALTACSALDTGTAPSGKTVVVTAWTCSYSVTLNHDWHDDVLCSKGAKTIRPYLRKTDKFVTEDELMASARRYQARLNAKG